MKRTYGRKGETSVQRCTMITMIYTLFVFSHCVLCCVCSVCRFMLFYILGKPFTRIKTNNHQPRHLELRGETFGISLAAPNPDSGDA